MKDEPKGKAANAAQGALGDIEELDSSDTQKHPVSEELSDPNVAGENEISQSDINSGSPSSGVDPAFSAAALHEPKAKHWSERIPIWRSIKAIQRQVDSLEARHQAQLHWHQHQLTEHRERANKSQSQLMRHQIKLAVQQDELNQYQEALAQTNERSVRQQEAVTRLQEALAQTDERSARQQEEINRYQDELNLQQDQLLPLQNQIQAQVDSSQELDGRFSALSRSLGFEHAQNPAFDRWYQNLQDLHRGSGEALAKAQASYLSYFEPLSSLLKPAGPILDLGCGRGEWLSLLANQGWQVLGVDSSELVVDVARENGLEVQLGDLLTVLEAQPANSLAAVTAFQVIEHLPFETIVALVHAAFRALLPGGILLLETPNPENIQVAAYSFWMDPTHKKPIPPPLIMDLSYHAGFRDGLVLRQNPWPNWDQTPAEPSFEGQMNQRLFGPQDYAVLAYKPVKTS